MCDLPEFNLNIYASAVLSGHRCFAYRSMGTYGVIRPADGSLRDSEYELSAGDMEVWEMATGIDEFKVYYNVLS